MAPYGKTDISNPWWEPDNRNQWRQHAKLSCFNSVGEYLYINGKWMKIKDPLEGALESLLNG